MENSDNKLGLFLAVFKQFFDSLEKVPKSDLGDEFEDLLEAITYERFSPRVRRKFINVAEIKKDIIVQVMNGKSISDLHEKYDRSNVCTYKSKLLNSGVIVRSIDGRISLNPKKYPNLYFNQLIKDLNSLNNT